MLNRSLIFWVVIAFWALLPSCNPNRGEQQTGVLAKVYNNYLYEYDLFAAIPRGMMPADSIAFVKRFVDNWVSQQVFLRYAQRNLSNEEMNFDRELENYRNSLIAHKFESKLIEQELDTAITEQELISYHQRHAEDFRLMDNIVRARLVILPLNAPDMDGFRRLLQSTTTEDLDRLYEFAVNHAVTHFLDTDTWLIFEELMRVVPMAIDNPANFLANNRLVEFADDNFRYFVYFVEYQLEGSVAPLAFARDRIREILIIQKKSQLINNKRNQLFQDALRDRRVEVFVK